MGDILSTQQLKCLPMIADGVQGTSCREKCARKTIIFMNAFRTLGKDKDKE